MKNRIRKIAYIAIPVLVLAVVLGVLWMRYASPTKVALLNFQPYMSTSIKLSNADRFIKIEDLSVDELDKLGDYDFVLGFGMGFHLTAEQRAKLEAAVAKKVPIMIYAATTPENNISSLDSTVLKQVQGYMGNGNKLNYKNMLRYIRKVIDRKSFFAAEPDSVKESASDVLYHLDDTKSFKSVADYEAYLKKIGHFRQGAPRLAMVGGLNDPFSGNRENIDSMIVAFEKKGMNVYPVSSFMRRLDLIREINPDAVVYFPHGRLAMMQPDAAIEWFKEHNIPLFAPLTILQKREDWEKDKMGMFGGFMSQSIVMPELDGAIYPYAVTALEEDNNGIARFKAIPDRLASFTQIVQNFINLKHKANGDKKVAIYYFKGPGQASLTAQGLETVESLYNLLKFLKREGYRVDGLPADFAIFKKQVMQQGAVLSSYAEGAFDQYLKSGNPALVERSVYESWAAKAMPKSLYADVTSVYGDAPGKYLAVEKNGRQYLAVSRLQFGNVAILPQPMAAVGSDAFAIVHGAKTAPPHTYIGSYLWSRFGFGADAIIHFGTHGSLEFTPQKQVALSSYDWPDRLVGTVPHFYYYTIGNIGESVMAKRRSYATLISYLTPPFMESNTRSQYKELQDKIQQYYKTPDKQKGAASLVVKRIAVKMGIHRDLRIDSSMKRQLSQEDVERIENFSEEIASEKINGELYTTGVPYASNKITSTVLAMCADPIAYSLAALDEQRGKVAAAKLKSKAYFNTAYLEPAKRLTLQLIGSGEVSDRMVCQLAGVSEEQLAMARMVANSPKRGMGGMRSAQRGSAAMGSNGSMPSAPSHKERDAQGGESRKHGHGMPQDGRPDGVSGATNSVGAKGGHPGMHGPDSAKAKMMASGHRHQVMDGVRSDMAAMHGPKTERGKPAKGSMKSQGAMGNPAMAAAMHGAVAKVSKKEKQMARAIVELERTIKNVKRYKAMLLASPGMELKAIANALSGGYVEPGSGGDAVANPNAVPTGRNMYSVNAEATPSEVAWEKGVAMAEATIASYKKQHGTYPKKISYTFWSSEFIESEGATIAQVLYMLGVEPNHDSFGRVSDIELIDSKKLGRPRIDVVVQTSGQFRDIAASRLALITRAVELAAASKNDVNGNYVASSTVETERLLVDQGVAPAEARELSTQRVFGGVNGMYGTNIQGMITSSDKWESEKEIADTYINNMGALYGSDKSWGNFHKGLLRAVLHNTDVIVQPRQNNTWGALSLDHVYEFMGGMNLAIRSVTGKDPDAYFADYRNRNSYKMQDLKEAIGVESRSTIFNPTYVKELMKGGASSAARIEEVVTNTFGWNVTKPAVIDNEMWDEMYNVYVKDKLNLGVQKFFERENNAALQEITAVMLESARKGMWKATAQQMADIAKLHTQLVQKFGASGSGFAGSNAKLQQFIASKVDPTQAGAYRKELDKMYSAKADGKKGKVLKKEEMGTDAEVEKTSFNGLLVVGLVLAAFVGLVLILRKKRKQ